MKSTNHVIIPYKPEDVYIENISSVALYDSLIKLCGRIEPITKPMRNPAKTPLYSLRAPLGTNIASDD